MAMIGASGLLGRRALARWHERGFTARLLCRSDSAVAAAQPGPSEVVMGDLFDAGALRTLVRGCDVVVNLATALKPVQGVVDWRANDRVRREGAQSLLQACLDSGVPRLVQQSVAFVEEGNRLTDGTGPLAALPHLASARDMEAAIEQSGIEALILRGGLFWGTGTAMQAWVESQSGARPLPAVGRSDLDWVSLIHLEDMADAIVEAACSSLTGRIAIVDGEPLRWRELVPGQVTRPPSAAEARPGLAMLPSFRVSSAAAMRALHWHPNHRGRELLDPAASLAARTSNLSA
jgi:nucleoside-diphosphate-sugar epimerase